MRPKLKATLITLKGITSKICKAMSLRLRYRLHMNTAHTIPLNDADLAFDPEFYPHDEAKGLFDQLLTEIPWRAENITLFGKTMPQPRLIAWYGDSNVDYGYSGQRLEALPWTPLLQTIKARVESMSEEQFNSVLLNLYRNERDSMGLHADDEPELGVNPTIASLSLGEERVFRMKHKRQKELKPLRLNLANGSLLLMRGATQANWKHEVPKSRHPCGPRISLTFRRVGLPAR